jgi:hypothetical protein
LCVALANAYFSLLFIVDDIRVVVRGGPALPEATVPGGYVDLTAPYTLSFINSGTRAAVITDVYISLEFDDEHPICEGRNDWNVASVNLEPVIIKAGEIVLIKNVQLPPWKATDSSARYELKVASGWKRVRPCMQFNIITPDNARKEKMVRLNWYIAVNPKEGAPPSPDEIMRKDGVLDADRPNVLVQERFLFGSTISQWWNHVVGSQK